MLISLPSVPGIFSHSVLYEQEEAGQEVADHRDRQGPPYSPPLSDCPSPASPLASGGLTAP